MTVLELNIKDLKPYENNPRDNSEAARHATESIRQFGFNIPILVKEDMTIIAGHTRLKAAKAAGLEKVSCIILSHLSEEEETAFRLADNKVGEISTWNQDKLAKEIQKMSDVNWSEYGFSEKHLKQLIPPEECTCPKCGRSFIET